MDDRLSKSAQAKTKKGETQTTFPKAYTVTINPRIGHRCRISPRCIRLSGAISVSRQAAGRGVPAVRHGWLCLL